AHREGGAGPCTRGGGVGRTAGAVPCLPRTLAADVHGSQGRRPRSLRLGPSRFSDRARAVRMPRPHGRLGLRRLPNPRGGLSGGRGTGLHARPRPGPSGGRGRRSRNVTRTVPLETLLSPVPSPHVTGNARTPISGIAIDSRRVEPGDLFVALAGEKT